MNCQNVRGVIEAADQGDLLSAAAMEHIRGCAACEKLNDEHLKLRDIVSNLGTVKAPEDFEFRLRARLARANAQTTRPTFAGLNFGFRSIAFASLMVLFGGAMLVFNFRQPNPDPSQPGPAPQAIAAATPFQPTLGSPVAGAVSDNTSAKTPDTVRRNVGPKRLRTGTRDMASTPARVLRPSELMARASDFPIDASPQPVKVSVDDGRGSSRTISVPRVSFGSQRVLSQSTSPLVASARGAW
jgi:hypothetical protein